MAGLMRTIETGTQLMDMSWVTRSPAHRGPAPSAMMKGPWSAHLRRRDQTRSVSVPDDGLEDRRKLRGCPQLCPRLNIAEVGLVDAEVSEARIEFR